MTTGTLTYIDSNSSETAIFTATSAENVTFSDTTVANFLQNISIVESSDDLDTDDDTIATTEFVNARIQKLTGVVPSELDTFEELYNAIGQDSNISLTLSTMLDTKQDSDTTLTALSNLSFSQNNIFYSTSENSFSTTSITSTALNILSQATAKNIRRMLGIYENIIFDECENSWSVVGSPQVSNGTLIFADSGYSEMAKQITLGGSNPFTLELKAKISTLTDGPSIFILFNSENNRIRLAALNNGKARLVGKNNSSVWSEWDSPTCTDDLHHFAFSYNGTTVFFFFDGQLVNSASYTLPAVAYSLGLGGVSAWLNAYFYGSIDEFRLSNVCRYTTNFVPSETFSLDDNTISLLHFD